MRTKTIALRTRLLGSGGTTSGVLGGIGSVHNVCHSLCVTVVSIAAFFGITMNILPLMFLQTYQLYFWWAALIFTVISFYLYLKQRHKRTLDRNLLFINYGLLAFGLPLSGWLADYMDFFRFFGGALALSGLFLLIFGKRIKTVHYPVVAAQQESTNYSVNPIPAVNSIKLPKLTVSSMLFAIVIGGFLVNQYFMWQLTKGGKVSVSSSLRSVMQKVSNMKLTSFDVALAKERMDKNNDGICDTCGMDIQQCIDSGQLDCNMGNNSNAIGVLGSQHIHADFKVYVNGQPVDFSDKDHMGRMRNNLPVSSFIHVDSGSPAPEKTGDVLHMHATKIPLSLFFRSLGMSMTKDTLTLIDGRLLKNENGNTLKFYLNGQKVDDLDNYSFQDLDKLFISFGPENDPDIQRQLNSVTNFAKNH